jgi:hypothetical protein
VESGELENGSKRVHIHGDGVAAACCAHLLGKKGFQVIIQPSSRPRLPAIMLSNTALQLIRDVFGNHSLFHDQPHVRRRIVAWGVGAKPLELDHSATVVSEDMLLHALNTGRYTEAADEPNGDAKWNIFTKRPLPEPADDLAFGSRTASAHSVTLRADVEPEACWIESLHEGWIFLITTTPGRGWLLCVGCSSQSSAVESRLIATKILEFGPPAGAFPAYPRISSPLQGTHWLACGTAAIAFDPLCGDGTANAVREGILTSAVIVASERGGDVAAMLSHYEDRLTAGFKRHLEHCLVYYQTGSEGAWWRGEADSIRRGLHWCDEKLAQHGQFRYKLDGFDLSPTG